LLQLHHRPVALRTTLLLGVLATAALLTTGALVGSAATPQPNAVLGQTQFTSAGCGACHMFAAARSKGKIGPDLDAPILSVPQIVQQITLGGYTILGNAAKKQYPFPMAAFKGKLSTAEISNIAAFVYLSRNAKAVPKGASIPITYGKGGGSTSKSSTSTTPSSSTTATAPPAPLANNGCPAGQTIQTSGATDNDGDEGGAPSDNDGCI
jgi:mono/diheme cytochrome c family protein